MGQYDSSRTRVAPVFDRLLAINPTGRSWLPALLELVAQPLPIKPLAPQSDLQEACWWPRGKSLAPPHSLLVWLVENLQEPQNGKWEGVAAEAKRRLLVAKDPATIAQALELLRMGVNRGWHILEGPSSPDVFLATTDAVIVIEGKRTERGPTTRTTWMSGRHQMLRHLDAALEILGDRRLYGFFIVESTDTAVPSEWIGYAQETVSDETLNQSLPHRTPEEHQRIKQAFLGVTTWQSLCDRLTIPPQVLIARVADVQPDPQLWDSSHETEDPVC